MPTPPSLNKYMKNHFKEKIKNFITSDEYMLQGEVEKFRQSIHGRLPQKYIDKFMNDIIAFYIEDITGKKWLKRVIEVMLSKNTRILKISSNSSQTNDLFDDLYQRFICFTVKMMKFHRVNLTHLELHCPTLGFSEFKTILPLLINLEVLKLKPTSMDTSDIMGVILTNCKRLEHFELIDPHINLTRLTVERISYWSIHEKIRVLIFKHNFNFLKISPLVTASLLKLFPNLEIFEWKETAQGILELAPQIPISLNELIFDSEANLSIITEIYQYYPRINTIKLNHPQIEVIEFLHNFKHLKNLTIYSLKPYDAFEDFISRSGSQLESLTIGMCYINLTLLLQNCPNLIFLDLQNSPNIILMGTIIHHKNLKCLFLKNAPQNVMVLLEGLSAIETLKMFYWMNYDPVYLDRLLPKWTNLKVLSITNAPHFLTACMLRIIKSCHKLKEISTLQYEWKTLFIEILKKDISMNNFPVHIT